ncbi:MAG: hypothetical protein K6T85_10735 [Gorillibacterium sp.]|nr:hypothetical protein [Gorillibacterium sp.]
MEKPVIQERYLDHALFQFIFPFSIKSGMQADLKAQLKQDGYKMFFLNDLASEDAYYGEGYHVSHRHMERYYLPFTGNVLFPHSEDPEAFQRYSRSIEREGILESRHNSIPFRVLSADVVICPFKLGFITIRIRLDKPALTYTEALEFANRFRVLQDVSLPDDLTFVNYENQKYKEIEDFIFKVIVASTLPFFDSEDMEGAYFETMPFFVDERMYVQAFYSFEDQLPIDDVEQYRAARIDGLNINGQPFISSTNPDYIASFVAQHAYKRWGPDTYYVMDENSFNCITNLKGTKMKGLANQMYGEYYYGLLLTLFHKIVLLKLSNNYSKVRYDRNSDDIEELIGHITRFSSKYFFQEMVTQSQGKEIFGQLRRIFSNNDLYEDVKQTLGDLYKYQSDITSRRTSYMIMIFTVFTVISGIYGMNQVIEDLKGQIDWSIVSTYSLFQYIALIVTIVGLITGIMLGLRMVYQTIKSWRKKFRKDVF